MRKQEIIQELRDRLSLPALSYNERVQGSRRHDTFEHKMAECLDKQMALAEMVLEYELFRDKIFDQVLNLKDDDDIYSEMLYRVYFKDMKLKDVAKLLWLSIQYTNHIHPLALEMFYDQYLSEAGRTNPEWQGAESFEIIYSRVIKERYSFVTIFPFE